MDFGIIPAMKKIVAVAFACLFAVANAGTNDVAGITTNLVVYTDIHSPNGTSHYYATLLALTIRNGIITECRNEGRFDLFTGRTASDEERARAITTNRCARSFGTLRQRKASRTNDLDRATK